MFSINPELNSNDLELNNNESELNSNDLELNGIESGLSINEIELNIIEFELNDNDLKLDSHESELNGNESGLSILESGLNGVEFELSGIDPGLSIMEFEIILKFNASWECKTNCVRLLNRPPHFIVNLHLINGANGRDEISKISFGNCREMLISTYGVSLKCAKH